MKWKNINWYIFITSTKFVHNCVRVKQSLTNSSNLILNRFNQEVSSKLKSQPQSQTQTIQVKPSMTELNRQKQNRIESNRVNESQIESNRTTKSKILNVIGTDSNRVIESQSHTVSNWLLQCNKVLYRIKKSSQE